MTFLWSTAELPGARWNPDPEPPPDEDDDGPYCIDYVDLLGQRAGHGRLRDMTTVTLQGDLL